MKKRRWTVRTKKIRQYISDEEGKTLRSFIAKTWQAIGILRKKNEYDTKKKPWNPCLRAQQNYVAWCQKHKVNLKCWDNFVYYFGLRTLFWDHGPMMPDKLSIAEMELEIASGSNSYPRYYLDKDSVKESLPSYEDRWEVMLTVRGELPGGAEPQRNEDGEVETQFRLKKKLVIHAKSWPSDGKAMGPTWSVSYRVPRIWCTPRFTSQVTIDYRDRLEPTRATYGQWWVPVLASLGHKVFMPKLQVQVQPLTHRYQHEIDGNRWGAPRYEE